MNNNLKSLLNEKKSKEIDAFGLTYQKLNSDEIVDTKTPYDSFVLEDSLRIIASYSSLEEIKNKMKYKLDEETGLYVITIGDVNSEYYRFATMLNRMTDEVYSKKVWRSVTLMRNILGDIKRDYLEEITTAISSMNGCLNNMKSNSGRHM